MPRGSKCQLATLGMPGTKKNVENDLTASVTGSRSMESATRCSPLASNP